MFVNLGSIQTIITGEFNTSTKAQVLYGVLLFWPVIVTLTLYNFHCFIKENDFSIYTSETCPNTISLDFTMMEFLLCLLFGLRKHCYEHGDLLLLILL